MAVFRVRCMNPARGRDIHAFPLLWRHEGGPWACRHRSLDRLRRDWRTGDVHRTFCDAAVQKVPPGRQNVCTSSVGLPRPHQQPKETCPRLIWPLCFDFRAQNGVLPVIIFEFLHKRHNLSQFRLHQLSSVGPLGPPSRSCENLPSVRTPRPGRWRYILLRSR